jgi:hypothetical protein
MIIENTLKCQQESFDGILKNFPIFKLNVKFRYFFLNFRFLLPSEAFGYTNKLESKYNSEKIIPPFEPRIFDEAHFNSQNSVSDINQSFKTFIWEILNKYNYCLNSIT